MIRLRLPEAPPVAILYRVVVKRLDLDQRDMRKVYKIIVDAIEKRRLDDDGRAKVSDSRRGRALRVQAITGLRNVEAYWNFFKATNGPVVSPAGPVGFDLTLRRLKNLMKGFRWPVNDQLSTGPRKEEWIAEARKKLQKLGLKRKDANDLLVAIGLSTKRGNYKKRSTSKQRRTRA